MSIPLYEDKPKEESMADYVKRKTNELYDLLPVGEGKDIEAARRSRIDVRDAVFTLNYKFFGYVATHTFINNNYISYEDKFQSACTAFLKMWHKYRWTPRYRADLSFAVFFKLRIGEELERELNEVKYSVRRDLCMKVGDQLGKHWGRVTYEDLSDPRLKLSGKDMAALQASFGSLYQADLEDQLLYRAAEPEQISLVERFAADDNYDDIPSLLIKELIDVERQLVAKDFRKLSEIYGISEEVLKAAYPEALSRLYQLCKSGYDVTDQYSGPATAESSSE